MNILAIETSCDETSAAVVADGRRLLSNIVASQVETHALYGGVVPEIASRAHTEAISTVVDNALKQADMTLNDIDAIAVTYAPGLIGALLTGLSYAKGLSYAAGKPLIPVHHIRGHVASNYLVHENLKPPFYALVVSGGHTSLMLVNDYTDYEIIGHTRDDAAGEAFDKAARVLGLPYPGGAALDRLASQGNPDSIKFTSATVHDAEYDFSFSGLKTAVVNYAHTLDARGVALSDTDKANIAASFTKTLINTISVRLEKLLDTHEKLPLVLAGGVAANSHLRKALEGICNSRDIPLFVPPLKLCGDNAAMIASQGFYEFLAGNVAHTDQNAYATMEV